MFKLKVFLKGIKILRNWYLYPLLYYGVLENDPILYLRNGLKIKIRINSTDIQAFTNVWILEEYNHRIFSIDESDVIIDIGAHIGLFSLYVSQFCKNGSIYCFEPIKENYELLLFNTNLNRLKNVKIFQKAVADKSEIVKIHLSSDAAAHSLFGKGSSCQEVESISLKEILDENKIENCNLLKMDCEGSEYLIMNSLPDKYFEYIQKIVMEYHLAAEKPILIEDLIKKLTSLDYEVIIEKNTDDYGLLFATRKSKPQITLDPANFK